MSKAILYTRISDGGVNVCWPSQWAIGVMSSGGMWSDMPRGYLKTQIERGIERGRPERAQWRYVTAMHFGGCSTAEALEIIRDRDCEPFGTAFEAVEYDEIPQDRWFRNAWKRSPNGGPITIDMKLARNCQFQHIKRHLAVEQQRFSSDLDLIDKNLDIDLRPLINRILDAKDLDRLRMVWPDCLPRDALNNGHVKFHPR